jgi:hypothetical protein
MHSKFISIRNRDFFHSFKILELIWMLYIRKFDAISLVHVYFIILLNRTIITINVEIKL